jgi:uncharacterized membrane protein YfcA
LLLGFILLLFYPSVNELLPGWAAPFAISSAIVAFLGVWQRVKYIREAEKIREKLRSERD